jgi:hypothetical protein
MGSDKIIQARKKRLGVLVRKGACHSGTICVDYSLGISRIAIIVNRERFKCRFAVWTVPGLGPSSNYDIWTAPDDFLRSYSKETVFRDCFGCGERVGGGGDATFRNLHHGNLWSTATAYNDATSNHHQENNTKPIPLGHSVSTPHSNMRIMRSHNRVCLPIR